MSVAALYKTTHPEYASYLYLVAPINLAVLNPVAFILMEVHKRRIRQSDDQEMLLNQEIVSINDSSGSSGHKKRCKMIMSVMRNIFFNPIIFMTILGIVGNFIFHHQVPVYFGGILNVILMHLKVGSL